MNPFKRNGQISPIASINSLIIGDIKASDLFRPELIINEILKYQDILGVTYDIEKSKVSEVFNNALNSNNTNIKAKAIEIASSYGVKLSKVLLTLIKPSKEAKESNSHWSEEHWSYWEKVERIYLVGGLTSPILTKIFHDQIKIEFENHLMHKFKVSFIVGSYDLGTKGLSKLVSDGEFLLFDFGQTLIKRRQVIKNDSEFEIDRVLPSVSSKYLEYKNKDNDQLNKLSVLLDEHMIKTVLDTINMVDFSGDEVYIAIANYVHNGVIYPKRGGYAKLARLSDNYQKHLSQKISNSLEREVKIRLYHDTSAMALNFQNDDQTAVISLGTAFGVGFPQ